MNEAHGGNIYRLAEGLGINESAIIDFSASINPLGVPGSVIEAIESNVRYLFNYPDPDTKGLRLKISEHQGISPEAIICGNGSTELIFLIARALKPASVLIPAPTFSEYERACKAASHELRVTSYELNKENDFDIDADEFVEAMEEQSRSSQPSAFSLRPPAMAFLCNPNNPTGRLMDRKDMINIADSAKALKCALVVDEAFIDFCPGASIIDQVAGNPYLILLRSMTKFYALSGLRVGYMVLSTLNSKVVKEIREPWTVNTLAQIAGVAALDDKEYEAETFKTISEERKRLEEGFGRLGIPYLRSTVNYYLLRPGNARDITASLKKQNILVRDCSNFPGLDGSYIRVAVKSESQNARLLEEMGLCLA